MRYLLIGAAVFAVAFILVRGKINRAQEEKMRQEDQVAMKAAESDRKKQAEHRQAMESRFVATLNCDTAINNRQVLQDAITQGGVVTVELTGPPVSPVEYQTRYNDMQRFIEQNCGHWKPSPAYCQFPENRNKIVCR